MTAKHIISEALTLSPSERLEVIDQLWDSLASGPEILELTDEQIRELDRRIDDMDANPDTGIPWTQIKAERRNQR